MTEPEKDQPRSRGIYLLPNLLTTAALFAAFYSIVAAMKGYFDTAAAAVFVAMVADGLDGRVARMTNTQTEFGAHYDSMADMVSFGVAPALVVYSWSLWHLGKLGWLAAFIYTAATSLRLARFNAQLQDQDKRYFQGLPSPAAAGVVAGAVWLGSYWEWSGPVVSWSVAVLTVIVAGLMVSSVRYYSFKEIEWKNKVPFFATVVFVFVMAAIATDPPQVLSAIFFIYALSGPIMTLWQKRKMQKAKRNRGKE